MKPGWQSSEAWAVAAAILTNIANALGLHVSGSTSIESTINALLALIGALIYAFLRTKLKEANPPGLSPSIIVNPPKPDELT
jgi:hypothetical protein